MVFELMAEPSPIIIIGAARSGTKFLRDVLSSVDGVRCVPYDVNYVWRYQAEDAPDDVLDPDSLNEKKIRFIRSTLNDLAGVTPGDVLVEKSVSNTIRIPFVDRVFPDARYIHLIRDGRDVTESAMRQWKAPPDLSALWTKLKGIPLANLSYVLWFAKNFLTGLVSGRKGGGVWGPRFPGIEEILSTGGLVEVCARQWMESVSRAKRDLAALPGADYRVFEIRYEDLISGDKTFTELVTALELPQPQTLIENLRSRRRPGQPSRWRDLPVADQSTLDRIFSPKNPDESSGG